LRSRDKKTASRVTTRGSALRRWRATKFASAGGENKKVGNTMGGKMTAKEKEINKNVNGGGKAGESNRGRTHCHQWKKKKEEKMNVMKT